MGYDTGFIVAKAFKTYKLKLSNILTFVLAAALQYFGYFITEKYIRLLFFSIHYVYLINLSFMLSFPSYKFIKQAGEYKIEKSAQKNEVSIVRSLVYFFRVLQNNHRLMIIIIAFQSISLSIIDDLKDKYLDIFIKLQSKLYNLISENAKELNYQQFNKLYKLYDQVEEVSSPLVSIYLVYGVIFNICYFSKYIILGQIHRSIMVQQLKNQDNEISFCSISLVKTVKEFWKYLVNWSFISANIRLQLRLSLVFIFFPIAQPFLDICIGFLYWMACQKQLKMELSNMFIEMNEKKSAKQQNKNTQTETEEFSNQDQQLFTQQKQINEKSQASQIINDQSLVNKDFVLQDEPQNLHKNVVLRETKLTSINPLAHVDQIQQRNQIYQKYKIRSDKAKQKNSFSRFVYRPHFNDLIDISG